MLKSFSVKNFRGLKELNINDLEHVNIIAGRNNAGKTALLEAIFLHAGSVNPLLALVINGMRGMERIAVDNSPNADLPWDCLFPDYDNKVQIEFVGSDKENARRAVTLRTEKPKSVQIEVGATIQKLIPDILVLEYENEKHKMHKVELRLEQGGPRMDPVLPVPTNAILVSARRGNSSSEDAQRYGKLEVEKRESLLLEALKSIEPRIQRIAMIVIAGEPVLHGDLGTARLLPLPLMGEGMVRLATIVLSILSAPDGIVLIDEVENGIHHSVMENIWRAIAKVARQNYTQIVSTTHSLECIQAAHRAFKDSQPYDLRVHRLDKHNSKTTVQTYDQETLEAALCEGFEVR